MSEPAGEAAAPAPPAAPEATALPPSSSPPGPAKEPRRLGPAALVAATAVVIVIIAVAAAPFWAPAVMGVLPWGGGTQIAKAAKPAPQAPPAAPEPATIAAKAEAAENAAALRQLTQRVATLEAKPPPPPAPDLGPIRQQLSALGQTTTDLDKKVAALAIQVQQQPAADPRNTALALVLLQIREAIDIGRPFAAEYQTLIELAHDQPGIASAAAPLAGAAESGVANRAVLTERLRQLAPKIATAESPPEPGWRAQIVAQLRALVTIRRVDGAGRDPAEVAVDTAQHALASGDLPGAIDALTKLSGANAAAAEPWLQMARRRVAAERALHAVVAALTAAIGHPAADKG